MKYNLVILCFLFSVPLFAQKDGTSILLRSYEELNKNTSLAYTSNYTFCGAGRYDTLNFYGNAHLLRKEEDTVFVGLVWLGEHNNTYLFYDGFRLFMVDKHHFTVHIYQPTAHDNVLQSFTEALIMRDFLKPNELKDRIGKYEVVKYAGDTMIDGRDCYTIAAERTDRNSVKIIERICIEKNHFFPLFYAQLYCFEMDNIPGQYQYSAFHVSAYDFAPINTAQFSSDQILKHQYAVHNHDSN